MGKFKNAYYAFMGNMKYSKGDMNGALEWFGKACEEKKPNPKLVVSYGYLLLKMGKIQEAEKVLERLLHSKQSDEIEMNAKLNFALVLWKKGELDKAVDMMYEVYDNYKNSTVYGSLGYLLIVKGDLKKALEFNLEAYVYNDNDGIILDNLGQTYYLRGEFNSAMEIYKKLMALSPSFAEAYYNYGLVLMKIEQYEKALEMIKKSASYTLSSLSTITRDNINEKIEEIEKKLMQGE